MARPKKTHTPVEGTGSEGGADGSQPVKKGKRYPKTKTEAVRRAMGRLGPDAMPLEIAQWVHKHYGMEMDKSHVSTVKSTLLKKMRGEEGGLATTSAFEPEVEMYPEDAANLSIAELRMVKEVLSRIGPDRFRDLPELLGS
jgi:hypothetical protein